MTKRDDIIDLFREYFIADSFLVRGKAKEFHCCNERECEVNQRIQPIWSPYLGDEDTNVMIVAEAPSRGRRIEDAGPHIGGLFENIDRDISNEISPIHILKPFVQENYDRTIPYFTDLVKCGVAIQNQVDKKIIKKRAPKCCEQLLLKEIGIVKPEIILCIGNLSKVFLQRYQSEGKISNSIELIPLMHYGRQATLTISPEDKKDIIWKWQAGKISPEEFARIPLYKLSSKFWNMSKRRMR